jgi:hypothetical protein
MLVRRLAALLGIGLAGMSQVESSRGSRSGRESTAVASDSPAPIAGEAEVADPMHEVYDRADETGYITGTLSRGDRVRVHGAGQRGWLAIDPPPTMIAWVERSALDLRTESERTGGHVLDVDESGARSSPPARAWVVGPGAVVRSGHPQARLPGPPWGRLGQGRMVQLVDRPPIQIGRGTGATVWYAIVPPQGMVCYIRAGGTKGIAPPPGPIAETLAAYLVEEDPRHSSGNAPAATLPGEIATEIDRLEAMHRAILTRQAIEQWQFEAVRAGYQALLKRSGDNPAVEQVLRVRLARVTRQEQAAQAARTIRTILAQSHRRDLEVAAVKRRLAKAERAPVRGYSAIGFVQPSARLVEGRKLYALIGLDGSTLAYLDLLPGVDPNPLLAHRVGIRGTTHYNEDLGTRLITVRDMEMIESRR